jgi:quercetin dioxygenase-like cupin family protein
VIQHRPEGIGTVTAVSYSVVHVDEIEAAGPGGAVRFVRRELGVEAFGINWFELPPGAAGHEHSEAASGQEEVLVVIRGAGHWRIDGAEVPVREGSFVRIDPEANRCPVAGPEGMTFVAVGARRGAYEPRGPF